LRILSYRRLSESSCAWHESTLLNFDKKHVFMIIFMATWISVLRLRSCSVTRITMPDR
jgi:hypothetical protein